jgi:hypothetical protein
VRPRGPLVFRVAERLSTISDALYLEAMRAEHGAGADSGGPESPPGPQVSRAEQARRVADWVRAGPDRAAAAFPGRSWLRQPPNCSDREWILAIAGAYAAAEVPDAAGARVAG